MILNEEKIIKRQLIKNTIYNFIVFTIIFTIFGVTIFSIIKNYIYESSEKELQMASQRVYFNDTEKIKPVIIEANKIENENYITKRNIRMNDRTINNIPMSPNITYIVRNENGEVTNEDTIGRTYEYIENVSFDSNNLDTIYDIIIDEKYSYKGINIKVVNENNETKYIQLLINVDAQKAIVDNYFKVLVIGIGITILLSIIASYVLSKKALLQIISSWKKQTEFVQNASHELRTPLTIIQAKQELLLQEPASKIIDKSEDIMLTLNEAKRLSKMTKELMILARADADKVEIKKENVQIDEIIKQITLPYVEYAAMEEKQIILNLEYNQKASIDVNKIHQLMVILLDNAIKYTKSNDTIEIHTYLKDGKCNIEIKDTGIGISDEGVKHVFERFYREDKARSRKTGGSGLGLSIAEYIVTLHKGTIKIAHNVPKGTIVIIKIPRN